MFRKFFDWLFGVTKSEEEHVEELIDVYENYQKTGKLPPGFYVIPSAEGERSQFGDLQRTEEDAIRLAEATSKALNEAQEKKRNNS